MLEAPKDRKVLSMSELAKPTNATVSNSGKYLIRKTISYFHDRNARATDTTSKSD